MNYDKNMEKKVVLKENIKTIYLKYSQKYAYLGNNKYK